LLEYVGVPYTDTRFTTEWQERKHKQGFDFPNLPSIQMPDGYKITESQAIIHYLGSLYNLNGANAKETGVIDQVLFRTLDLARAFFMEYRFAAEEKKAEGGKAFLEKKLTVFGPQLDAWLAKNKWAGGENVSIADFYVYECYDQIQNAFPNALDEHKHIFAYLNAFRDLPRIKAYIASGRFTK